MRKLSTGQDSTLKSYRELSVVFFGEDSKAVEYLDKKIKSSSHGENEEILTDERQMIMLLSNLTFGG